MTLIAHHELSPRQQQPRLRVQRPLTVDQSQHVGVAKHGFASPEDAAKHQPEGSL